MIEGVGRGVRAKKEKVAKGKNSEIKRNSETRER